MCQLSCITKVESAIPRNIKSFWSHVNNLKSSHDIQSKLRYGTFEEVEPNNKCELLSQYFSSVFSAGDSHVPDFNFNSDCNINSCVVLATEGEKKTASPGP